jgi:hypothetical protein
MTSTALLTVEQVPIDQLRPDPANPRRISDEELESLERSVREWGFVQPVLARRKDSTVIGGHQRLLAARRLGLTTRRGTSGRRQPAARAPASGSGPNSHYPLCHTGGAPDT